MYFSGLFFIVALVLVGLICVFFLASSETRRSVGKVLAGMMFVAGGAVLAYLALGVFRVPLERALGAVVASAQIPPGMATSIKTVVPLLLVFLPMAFLFVFVFGKGKKEPKRPVAPTVVKEPSGPSAGKLLGGVAAGAGATLLIMAVFGTVVGMYRGSRARMVADRPAVRTFDHTHAESVPQAVRPRGLDEPLIVLDDEVEEPQTTATEPAEGSTSDDKKDDEKPLEESVDDQSTDEPVDEEPPDEKPATVAKSPSGDDPPDWVGRDGFRDGSVYMVPLSLDPGPTQKLCEEELLLPAVTKKIKAYASEKLGSDAAQHVRLPLEYIRGQMIGDDLWVEPVKVDSFSQLDQKLGREIWGDAANASTDDWVRLHALVKFDSDVDRRIEQQWIGALRLQRLQGTAGLVAVVLLALAGLYAYMRFDLATAGAYRNRLRVAALTAIMAVILVVLLNYS